MAHCAARQQKKPCRRNARQGFFVGGIRPLWSTPTNAPHGPAAQRDGNTPALTSAPFTCSAAPASTPVGAQLLGGVSEALSSCLATPFRAPQDMPRVPGAAVMGNSQLPTPNSQLPTPNSQLPTPNSRLPTPDSRLPANSPRPATCNLQPATCKQARPSGAFFPKKASPTSSPRAGNAQEKGPAPARPPRTPLRFLWWTCCQRIASNRPQQGTTRTHLASAVPPQRHTMPAGCGPQNAGKISPTYRPGSPSRSVRAPHGPLRKKPARFAWRAF